MCGNEDYTFDEQETITDCVQYYIQSIAYVCNNKVVFLSWYTNAIYNGQLVSLFSNDFFGGMIRT